MLARVASEPEHKRHPYKGNPAKRMLGTAITQNVVKRVGAARFELATSCSQSRRANQAALRPAIPRGPFSCESANLNLTITRQLRNWPSSHHWDHIKPHAPR